MVLDQDFVNNAVDFNNPLHFFGPSALDRTHQVSVGGVIDFPLATRVAFATHWDTAPPITLFLPSTGAPGDIFVTDVTGDGTVGDVVPGSNIGAFDRTVKHGNINGFINHYNSTFGGQLTPAGQALVTAGLFSSGQLTALGATTPILSLAPPGQVGVAPLFTFDVHVSWELKVNKLFHALPESVVVEPQIALYNLFNFHNYDPFGNQLSGVLGGFVGSANGTTAHGPLGRSLLYFNCEILPLFTGVSEINPTVNLLVGLLKPPTKAECQAQGILKTSAVVASARTRPKAPAGGLFSGLQSAPFGRPSRRTPSTGGAVAHTAGSRAGGGRG